MELSDRDFAVADDFESLASDLPCLSGPLAPLAQWDPYASHACYMPMFPGPTKVDLLFLDEEREWSAAWSPSPETLADIERHFWDWILWPNRSGAGDMRRRLLSASGMPRTLEREVRPAVLPAADDQ